MRNLKIALSGPSGLGKTTQCQYIRDLLNIPWLSTSAGDILPRDQKVYMEKTFGYTGSGHRDVINLSSSNPRFGSYFQMAILNQRGYQIRNSVDFVIDRCPIDNVAYMLAQTAHNADSKWMRDFISTAQNNYAHLTHVIRVEFSSDIDFIEDNGSRIPNPYFQTYMSDVFRAVYVRYFANVVGPKVITLDTWNLAERKNIVKGFLTYNQLALSLDEDTD